MLLAPQPLALFLLPALHALGCHQHLYLGLPTVVRTNLNMMVKISHATGSAVLFFSRSEAFYGSARMVVFAPALKIDLLMSPLEKNEHCNPGSETMMALPKKNVLVLRV